ncbi:MAG TPA: 1,4-dihydroxy-2-naphthoate polyprenyltransferase [Clostridiales bacterium]|nr:1,4-dihydroxy-2-naphthoate polyprenyltransferase [Clostridia bacterium]HCS75802.1 1,4-dihydroxy-2-naphthoate polyprenyltransferase [Clostridiales bacterium]
MEIKGFLKLVEIQTKAASMSPLLLGSIFAFYRYRQFNWTNFLLMLFSLLCFDMATTAINNYMDYRKAKKTEGFGYEKHNAIVFYKLSESFVLTTIFVLLGLAIGLGILLYLKTSPVVLIIGIISFTVGILYTFGPVPISRMPLGEIFSGFFMGFVILFLSVHIHVVENNFIQLSLQASVLNLKLNLSELLVLLLLSLPAALGISNIMLANNICDMEDDLENQRYTLPLYIGKKKSLILFQSLYYIAFLDILLLLIFRILPITVIPVLFTCIPVRKNISIFSKYQSKQDTFPLAIQNFLLINVSMALLIIPSFFL